MITVLTGKRETGLNYFVESIEVHFCCKVNREQLLSPHIVLF
jgi:hypothetical protein